MKGRSLPERLEEIVHAPAVEPFLAPASMVYGAGSFLRLLSFSMGLSSRTGAKVPVVSVGNLTVGGTGKTPVVIDLAERLSAKGLKVAILSRGYGRQSKEKFLVVSAGAGPVVPVSDAGDEPFMMARAVPEATVIVGSKRSGLAGLAADKYGAQIILLDDGFQHVQLRRDVDIVLYDYNDDPDKAALLPRGRLREPLTALSRASDIVITKIPALSPDNKEVVAASLKKLRLRLSILAPHAVLHGVRFAPSYLLGETDSSSGKQESVVKLEAIAGKKVLAVCGIARPQNFVDSLKHLGAEVAGSLVYSDHHWYGAEDAKAIAKSFAASGAEFIVTSEKDRVRLPLPPELASKTYALMLTPQWLDESGEDLSTPEFSSRLFSLAENGRD